MSRKFAFALQPVLEHRERIEDEKQQALAIRQQAHDEAKRELDRLNDAFRHSALHLRERHRELDAEELRLHYAHLQFLDRVIDAQTHVLAERRAAVERARGDLLAASKDRKVVEKLKERRRDGFLCEEMRIEQGELDESNSRQHGRIRGTIGGFS